MEEDAQAFIEELEKKRGAPLTWRTYATWYGNNQGIMREFGVFLYRSGNSLYFEDFERTPTLFGINIRQKRPKEPFIKYEGSFSLDEVRETRPVAKSLAWKVIQGRRSDVTLQQATFWDKTFRQIVEMVIMKDGTVHFFELMDRKQFINELQIRNKEE
ncbi:MAG: hypothetical protein AB7C91_04130 [Sphaerochaeta sp.]|uniref:hypothetical protein n=1 Tax=Sphaerochaeta sp. TaxID=1972642 RepID=UPI002FCA7B34